MSSNRLTTLLKLIGEPMEQYLIPAIIAIALGLALLYKAISNLLKGNCEHRQDQITIHHVARFDENNECIEEFLLFECECGEIVDKQYKDK